jgi:signal transduction histidine kinase
MCSYYGSSPSDLYHHNDYEVRILTQVMSMLARETHSVRQIRIVTRAASAIAQGYAICYLYDESLSILRPLAIIAMTEVAPDTKFASESNIMSVPECLPLSVTHCFPGIAALQKIIVNTRNLPPIPDLHHDLNKESEILGITPLGAIAYPCVYRDKVVGVLEVIWGESPKAFSDNIDSVLIALSTQIAFILAIDASIQKTLSLQNQIALAHENEYDQFTQELHNGPIQDITQTLSQLETIDRQIMTHLEDSRESIRQLYADLTHTQRKLGSMFFALRPILLETEGLCGSLHYLVERYRPISSTTIILACEISDTLLPKYETSIYAIIREALHNTIKYAKARQCIIQLRQYERTIIGVVRDDGIGFDADEMLANYPRGQSWGLLNIYDQARMMSAQITIHARPGQGTSIEFTIPLAE